MHCKKLSKYASLLVSISCVCEEGLFFVLLFNETMELNSSFKNVFLPDLWVVNLLI